MFIETLRAAFSGQLLIDPDDTAPYLIDWRKTWRGTALAVALPDTTDDVVKIVRCCAANGVRIVPQGGNTGQSGGSVPPPDGQNIVLVTTRLTAIGPVDTVNNSVTVGAGCVLQTVQDSARAADRLFPLSLGAEGSCTIGGNLATNAGGTGVLRYGNMRDLCIGLEVVTPEGEVWSSLKGLRKDNSGYDLRDLFIGSEGTLGIITGAVLKLFPMPVARLTAFVAVQSPEDAMALFAHLRGVHAEALTAFEIMSDACLDLVLRHFPDARAPFDIRSPWYVLVECSDMKSEAVARDALEESLFAAHANGQIRDAVVAGSLAQSQALWALRERISEAQGKEGRAIKHDVAVPISNITHLIRDGLAAVETAYPHFRPVIFGHLGDGNLHYNFSSASGADQDAFIGHQAALNCIIHKIVRDLGGTISAEHGLGVLRRDEAHAHRSVVERTLMRRIKQALDPQGLMNPEKMLGGDPI
jgi:FAD/FMN-containing dehydrogenase